MAVLIAVPILSPISHFRGKPTNGDYRREPRERSRSPIERLHAAHLYTHMPNLAMEQPLALTKNSPKVPTSPSASPIERQQVNSTTGIYKAIAEPFIVLFAC